jgi:ferritin-like metal-binding protein YciE
MILETMDDLLIDQLRDLYSAEIQLEVALPVIIDEMSSPLIRAALEQRFEETEQQILRLQEIFSSLGSTARGPRCFGMAGLLQETEDCLRIAGDDSIRETLAISSLRRVKHYEIAAYSAGKAYANRLRQGRTATLLGISLAEEIAADSTLARLLELEWKDDAIPAGAL